MKDFFETAGGAIFMLIMFIPSIVGIIVAFSEGILVGLITLLLPPLSVIIGLLYIFTNINLAETISGLL